MIEKTSLNNITFLRNTVLEFATKSNRRCKMMICERRGIPIPILNYLNYLRPLSHGNCRFRIRGWGRVLGTYMHINFLLHFTYIAFSNGVFSHLKFDFTFMNSSHICSHFTIFTFTSFHNCFAFLSWVSYSYSFLDSGQYMHKHTNFVQKIPYHFSFLHHLINHAGHEGPLFPWKEAQW